jgi:hypothetical protein
VLPSENSGAGTDATVHDAVVVAIPATLVLVALAGLAASLSVPTALGVASVPATGIVGYALFYRPPTAASET